ncbi:MAG: cation:proton antiporter [Candidatus ainarchaeum sp.]|jgi:CPA2 family monovalent cation:H+ antiporter-2|nr:cation:proton antiporter [Candidatus ainarchaeum sp.]
MSEVLPLTSIGIIMVLAISISFLVKKSGQNSVIGYILAGFILGPMFFNFLNPSDALVLGFGELGLFILLFYLGLEMSLKDFLKAGSTSIGLALIDMAGLVGIGFFITYISGFSFLFSIVVGMMAFSTSTAIVAKFALDKGLIQQTSAKLAISILILQDFLGIVLLVFLTSFFAPTGANPIQLGLAAIVFAVTAFFAVSKVAKQVEAWLESNGFGHTEVTLFALGIGLIVATLGTFLGLSSALGAYFAGFALAETKYGSKIKKDVGFLRDFMLVFFFVTFGTMIFYNTSTSLLEVPQLSTLIFIGGIALAVSIGIVFVNGVVFHIFGPPFGLSKKDSALIAIMLIPLGEFVIIIAKSSMVALNGAESALISSLAFLMILSTVIIFQPLYNLRELHEKFFSIFPSIGKAPIENIIIVEKTNELSELIKKFAGNFLVVLCFAWITILLYEAIPRFGVPIIYSRQITSILIFCFFASWPAFQAFKSLRKLFILGLKQHKKNLKRFAFKG